MTQPAYSQIPTSSAALAPGFIPVPAEAGFTAADLLAFGRIQWRALQDRFDILNCWAYYRGEQVVPNLQIATPPELSGIKVVMGWPRIAVDPYVERLAVDSFRLQGSTTPDQSLTDVWLVNGMDAEASIAFLESLAAKRCYYVINPGDSPDDAPRVSVESSLNMAVGWDLTGTVARYAVQVYWQGDRWHSVLSSPERTAEIAQDDDGQWVLVSAPRENFGELSIVRQANRPTAAHRDGESEITRELMSITDTAMRTSANMVVAGEFYSVPQKILLGVAESDFKRADGTALSSWNSYVSSILALGANEDGDNPDVKQLQAFDPSTYTKVIEMLAGQAAGIMGATPQDLGLYTQGNPVSADAYQVSESRRDRRARRMQRDFTVALQQVGQWVMRYLNKGTLPVGYDKLAVDWVDPTMAPFGANADGVSKLADGPVAPGASDVMRKRAGFTAVERAQLAELDKQPANEADEFVDDVAGLAASKAIRVVNTLTSAATASDPTQAPPAP